MTIDEFQYEFSGLTEERQKAGLKKLFDYVLNHIEQFDGLIDNWLTDASLEEQDDAFGTEGLNI